MSDLGQLHSRDTFGKVPEELIHDLSVTHGAARLYAHMHWRYGVNKKNFEGQRSMGDFLGVSRTTIQNWIDELAARDWLMVVYRGRNKKTGNFTTPYYHVFESQIDCRDFRDSYQPADKETVAPKPAPKERKLRKGKGGLIDPAHRANPDLHGADNTTLHGGEQLDWHGAANPDWQESDSSFDDDVQKIILSLGINHLSSPKKIPLSDLPATLHSHYTRLGAAHFKTVVERCKKRNGRSWDYYLNALRDEPVQTSSDKPKSTEPLTGQDYATGEFSGFIHS